MFRQTSKPVAGALAAAALAGPATTAAPQAAMALFEAIGRWDRPAVETLLQQDPSLAGAQRPDGRTVVMVAAYRIEHDRFVAPRENDVLQAILARKPRLGFFEACLVGDAGEVTRQLDKDPTLAVSWSPIGWSALHFAAFSGDTASVELLLARGAEINTHSKNKFRNSPLQVALLPGQYETARLLLERGADVLVRQGEGFAPIHEAALLGRQDLVDLLLAHGAEINARTNDGRTPLTEALRGGHKELAAYIKTKGGKGGEITADLTASPD
jgi:ankyrin repeat protein